MLRLSPMLTLIMMLAMPFVILATSIFRRSVRQSYRRIRLAIARINSYLQEHITGIAVLQLFNRESRSALEFDAVNGEHMQAYKAAVIAYGWFYPVVEFISMIAMAAILSYGGLRVQSGRPDPRRDRCVSAVRPALLPAHSGSQREIQHFASRHGLFRAHLQTARYSRHGSCAGRAGRTAARYCPHRIRPCLVRL